MKLKLLVAPNFRRFEREKVHSTLNQIHEQFGIDRLIITTDGGVSFTAAMWAAEIPEIECMHFEKDVSYHNTYQKMFVIGEANKVLAFCGSEETADVIELARKYDIEVIKIR